MTARAKHEFNVSIAEIDHQDVWQRTTIGIVSVASQKEAADERRTHAIRHLESIPEWEMTEIRKDLPLIRNRR